MILTTDVSCSSSRCVLFKHVQSFIHMFNFKQIITDYTRVSNSSSIIDLILVSDREKISQSGVINVGLSDHSIIYCTRKVSKECINKHNFVKVRSLKNYNKEDFQMNLINTDWSPVLLSDNVSDAWCSFKSIFLSVIDNLAPLKVVRIKQRTEPWVTNEILQCIKDRDKSFYTYKKVKSSENYDHFKSLRNKAQHLIYCAKRDFLKNSIMDNENDSKSLWNSLKELGMPSKKVKCTS